VKLSFAYSGTFEILNFHEVEIFEYTPDVPSSSPSDVPSSIPSARSIPLILMCSLIPPKSMRQVPQQKCLDMP